MQSFKRKGQVGTSMTTFRVPNPKRKDNCIKCGKLDRVERMVPQRASSGDTVWKHRLKCK